MILYVSIMRSSISEPLIQIHWCPKTDSECATSKCSKVPQDRRSCSTFFQCFSIPWIGNIAKPLLGYPPASGWEWIHHPLGLFHHHLWRAPRIHGHSMEIPWRWCHECHERLKTGWNQQDFGWSQGGFPILSDGSVMVRSPSLALTDLQKWHLVGGDGNHGMSHNFPRKYWEWKIIPTDELGWKTTNQIINHY